MYLLPKVPYVLYLPTYIHTSYFPCMNSEYLLYNTSLVTSSVPSSPPLPPPPPKTDPFPYVVASRLIHSSALPPYPVNRGGRDCTLHHCKRLINSIPKGHNFNRWVHISNSHNKRRLTALPPFRFFKLISLSFFPTFKFFFFPLLFRWPRGYLACLDKLGTIHNTPFLILHRYAVPASQWFLLQGHQSHHIHLRGQ